MDAAPRLSLPKLADDAIRDSTAKSDSLNAAAKQEQRRRVLAADAAILGGSRVADTARRLGMQRPRLYEQLAALRRDPNLIPLRVLERLAVLGRSTVEGVACDDLTYPGEVIEQTIRQLEREGLVRQLITEYERGNHLTYYSVTADGELEIRRALAGPTAMEISNWAIYFPFADGEHDQLVAAASEELGDEWFAVLQPGTLRGQELPEFAFAVPARSARDALAGGVQRYRLLREDAGLPPEHPLPTDVIALDGYESKFGTGG